MVLAAALALLCAGALARDSDEDPPRVGVAPGLHDVELDAQGRSRVLSFRVMNLSRGRPIRLRVSVENWEMDEDNQIRPIPPTEQSLDQWILINPVEFEIAPGKEQVVRFAVRPGVRLAPGEHRAMVWFTQVLDPVRDLPRRDGGQLVFPVRLRIGAAVYGRVAPWTRKGEILGVRCARRALRVRIRSSGNAHVRLQAHYRLEDGAGRAVAEGETPTTPILPGTTRALRVEPPKPLPKGRYALVLEGTLGEKPLRGRWRCVVE